MWWLGIGLMNLPAPGQQSALLLNPTFVPGFIGKVTILTLIPLDPGCEEYCFLDQEDKDLSMAIRILSVQTQSAHQNWMHTLIWLMPWLLQSLEFYTWLVPLMIILDHSLSLASNLINKGARLGQYFWQYCRQVKYQPLSWFLNHLAAFGSGLLFHLIASLWFLPIRRLVSLWFSD